MKLLDLFCGAGGAAMGYHQAGFDQIIGIDINPQPRYPFTFIQGDALKPPVRLDAFDLIHASPPCQAYSVSTPDKSKHPELVEPTRLMLSDHPYVIENVPGAPIRGDYMLCGSMFELRVADTPMYLRRHRYFEVSWPIPALHNGGCRHNGFALTVVGHGTPTGQRPTTARLLGRNPTHAERQEVMGIDWMTGRELSESIPPAYTRYIGEQFLEQR